MHDSFDEKIKFDYQTFSVMDVIAKAPDVCSIGALNSQGYPAVHRTPNGATGTQSSVRPVRSDTRLGFRSNFLCSSHMPNGPLELLRAI